MSNNGFLRLLRWHSTGIVRVLFLDSLKRHPMTKRLAIKYAAACALSALAMGAFAQNAIKVAAIVELSGGGATAGTNFKNGVDMAVREVNDNGGILGKKIELITTDTTTNPGVALGLTKKAIDQDVFAILALCSAAPSSSA
jgi:branched-chain amino acid transport system substrate-binding protein